MKVRYHPEFANDLREFVREYRTVSPRLGARFREEVLEALARIRSEPTAAGHFVNTGSVMTTDIRRRNLVSFPFFVIYGHRVESLVFGAIIASASDPLTWLDRFS